jgi:transposase
MCPNSTPNALVGLDIGKNIHVLGSYRSDDLTALHKPLTLYNNRAGFEQATRQIDELMATYPQVILGNEPTGIYYEAWGRELLTHYAEAIEQERFVYRLINPYMTKLSRTELLNGRPRKSDSIDTQAIARCLQKGQGMPAHFSNGNGLLFSDWSHRYRRLEHARRQLGIEIMGQLDRVWPGALVNVQRFTRAHPDLEPPVPLVSSEPLERKLVQALLDTDPNPYSVMALGVTGMQALLRQHVGRCGLRTAQHVVTCARQALLPPPEVASLYVQAIQDDWFRYKTLLDQLHHLAAQAALILPDTPAAVLTSVPGVSPFLAARYFGILQDPSRFPSADHIWAFVGFDPILDQSGDSSRWGHISKHGNPMHRDTLYLIGRQTARYCPPIRHTFLQAQLRFHDKRETRAVIHAAHKANRLLFRLLVSQTPFVADFCL